MVSHVAVAWPASAAGKAAVARPAAEVPVRCLGARRLTEANDEERHLVDAYWGDSVEAVHQLVAREA